MGIDKIPVTVAAMAFKTSQQKLYAMVRNKTLRSDGKGNVFVEDLKKLFAAKLGSPLKSLTAEEVWNAYSSSMPACPVWVEVDGEWIPQQGAASAISSSLTEEVEGVESDL